MTRNVELINIARIDLIKGNLNIELDSLTKILIDNYHTKIDSSSDSTRFEDSYCPSNPYLDEIIKQIKTDFYAATQEEIKESNFWGHIHEKNMSTNLHNHNKSYVSAVVYLNFQKEVVISFLDQDIINMTILHIHLLSNLKRELILYFLVT